MWGRYLNWLLTLSGVVSLAFYPFDKEDSMWDSWLYRTKDAWNLNFIVSDRQHVGVWFTSINGAFSHDGVHFADIGPVIFKDPEYPMLGSGSVWPLLNNNSTAETFVMNWSQEYVCPKAAFCQSIFFALSNNLQSWTKLNQEKNVFTYDFRYYDYGRWDTITVIPAEDSKGYYGYWTATPKNRVNGSGFGFSKDGLQWDCLPTPGPHDVLAEVGGAVVYRGAVYMLYNNGHLYSSLTPQGPFLPANHNFALLGLEGSAYFPRIWGGVYTKDPDLILLTHQQHSNTQVFLGLIKQVQLFKDGVMRATWWPNNNVLKGETLYMPPLQPSQGIPACSNFSDRPACPDLSSGLWVEGTMNLSDSAGLWIRVRNSTVVQPNNPNNSSDPHNFSKLKPAQRQHNAGNAHPFLGSADLELGWAIRWSPTRQQFEVGYSKTAGDANFTLLYTIDRAWSQLWPPAQMKLKQQRVSWKFLIRNVQWNLTATEFFVDDVMVIPAVVGWAPKIWTAEPFVADGFLAVTDGAKITGVHHLTLPSSVKPRKTPVPPYGSEENTLEDTRRRQFAMYKQEV